MGDEVKLMGYHLSMFVVRVKIALAEKGVKYEYKEGNLVNIKSALLLQINPFYTKVPILTHNRRKISESRIILEYIDEVWKDRTPLLPTDPYQRDHAKFWADFFDNKVDKIAKKIWTGTGKVDELEKEKKELIENLKKIEEVLGENPYFGGRYIWVS